jgi:hypothetical protein
MIGRGKLPLFSATAAVMRRTHREEQHSNWHSLSILKGGGRSACLRTRVDIFDMSALQHYWDGEQTS